MKKTISIILLCTAISIIILLISVVWNIPKLQVLSIGVLMAGIGPCIGQELRHRYINPKLKQKDIPLSFKLLSALLAIISYITLIISFVYLSLFWQIIAAMLNVAVSLYIIISMHKLNVKKE